MKCQTNFDFYESPFPPSPENSGIGKPPECWFVSTPRLGTLAQSVDCCKSRTPIVRVSGRRNSNEKAPVAVGGRGCGVLNKPIAQTSYSRFLVIPGIGTGYLPSFNWIGGLPSNERLARSGANS